MILYGFQIFYLIQAISITHLFVLLQLKILLESFLIFLLCKKLYVIIKFVTSYYEVKKRNNPPHTLTHTHTELENDFIYLPFENRLQLVNQLVN